MSSSLDAFIGKLDRGAQNDLSELHGTRTIYLCSTAPLTECAQAHAGTRMRRLFDVVRVGLSSA